MPAGPIRTHAEAEAKGKRESETVCINPLGLVFSFEPISKTLMLFRMAPNGEGAWIGYPRDVSTRAADAVGSGKEKGEKKKEPKQIHQCTP